MPTRSRLLPHPIASVALLLVWLLLRNSLAPGQILLGVLLAFLIPLFTSVLWPHDLRIGRPLPLIRLFFTVNWDIVKANLTVARLILTRPNRDLRSAFLVIPLDITDPYAIAALAAIISITPGTVAADLDEPNHRLLVHALDVEDPDAAIRRIKARYERPLKEIYA